MKKETVSYLIEFSAIVVLTIVSVAIQSTQNEINDYQYENSELFNKISLLQTRANIYHTKIIELYLIKSFGQTLSSINRTDSDEYITNLERQYLNKKVNYEDYYKQKLNHYGSLYSENINQVNSFSTQLIDKLKIGPKCWFWNCQNLIFYLYTFQFILIGFILYLFLILFKNLNKR